MNSQHDALLLRRLSQNGDPAAFAEITRLYGGLVYGTCLRVTGDAHHAADAAQETFFQLLRSARRVSGSLAGWLHRVAVRRAVDLVRSEAARRRREQAYVDAQDEVLSWNTLCPLVDEALDELEPDGRELLLRHFLQGQTMCEIAAAQRISQPTISRRMEEALEQLRGLLRKKGVAVTGMVLGALLPCATTSAPAAVTAQLGKMALTVSGAAVGGTAVSGAKIAAAVFIVAAGVGGLMALRRSPPPVLPAAFDATVRAPSAGNAVDPAPVQGQPGISAALVAAPPPTPDSVNTPAVSVPATSSVVTATGGGSPPPDGIGFGATARPRMGPAAPSPTTPEGALHRLVSALARGDRNGLQRCFAQGTTAYEGLRRILDAPASAEEREVKQCLESLVTPVRVLEVAVEGDGARIKWQATVRKPFTTVEDGTPRSWQAGDRFELEAQLKPVNGEWMITSF